jgi:nicotinamidase/pyrazinamidase
MNALLMIDIQKDFLPGGSLEVPEGDQVIPVVNEMQRLFNLVVATQDWHPANHGSFASNHPGRNPGEKVVLENAEQVLWPDHCVQGTSGAGFADELIMDHVVQVIQKGTDPRIDSYSGFFDNQHKRATGLHQFLKNENVNTVTIAGLAADVCVRYTALDALDLGYEVFLIEDATRAVGGPDAHRATMDELKEKGATIINSRKVMTMY